jgi:putative Ca2+/H+ antiporter (TMEM165/GDT1 family)
MAWKLTLMTDLATAFLTVAFAIFVAELTDKDALLLLTLAAKSNPWRVFAAGSVAFTITSAIIVLVGSAVVEFIPIFWIKVAGGAIMLGYAIFQYVKGQREDQKIEKRGESLARGQNRGALVAFLTIVLTLVLLDLAGDATELLIVVFVAQFQNLLLVFSAAVLALVAASAVETALGHRLGKLLSERRIRFFSIVVFLIIGSVIIASAILAIP